MIFALTLFFWFLSSLRSLVISRFLFAGFCIFNDFLFLVHHLYNTFHFFSERIVNDNYFFSFSFKKPKVQHRAGRVAGPSLASRRRVLFSFPCSRSPRIPCRTGAARRHRTGRWRRPSRRRTPSRTPTPAGYLG